MIEVHCDGLCEPVNPGGTATYGWVAYRAGVQLMAGSAVVARGPAATNNLAEYAAVIAAMRWLFASPHSQEPITIYSDSQLVIRQITREYRVSSPRILPLYQEASALADRLPNVSFRWIPREENADADQLSRRAYEQAMHDTNTHTEGLARYGKQEIHTAANRQRNRLRRCAGRVQCDTGRDGQALSDAPRTAHDTRDGREPRA